MYNLLKLESLFCLLLTANVMFSQNAQTVKPRMIVENVYQDIDLPLLQKVMGQTKNYTLMDVRTPEEIANGKIGNALEMDIRRPDFRQELDKLDKNKLYIVYCHAGGRSTTASNIMRELGFKQVYNFTPGYRVWPKE